MSTAYMQTYTGFDFDYDAIARYARLGEDRTLIHEAVDMLEGQFCYRVCYRIYPVGYGDPLLDLGFCRTESHDLRTFLAGHSHVLVLGATVGLATDRAVLCYGKTRPSLALVADAVGVERIETMLDAFCLEKAGSVARFSPGYGDLPLDMQKDIFAALPLGKLGMTLGESLLISPTKSVTALVGVDKEIL